MPLLLFSGVRSEVLLNDIARFEGAESSFKTLELRGRTKEDIRKEFATLYERYAETAGLRVTVQRDGALLIHTGLPVRYLPNQDVEIEDTQVQMLSSSSS